MSTKELKEKIMENYELLLNNLINESLCGNFDQATNIKKDILYRIKILLDMT